MQRCYHSMANISLPKRDSSMKPIWSLSHKPKESKLLASFTCFLVWATLFRDSGELELSGQSSTESSSFLMGSTMEKLEPRRAVLFLATAFVLLPVKPVCIDTRGVLTTKDESDLSFLLTGSGIGGITSGTLIFLLLKGKILALISCKLWSGLHIIIKHT